MPHADITVVRRDGRWVLQVEDRPPFFLDEAATASFCRAAGRLQMHVSEYVDSGPPYCLTIRVPYTDYVVSERAVEAYETYVAFDRRRARDAAKDVVLGELDAMGFTEARGYTGEYAVELTTPAVPEAAYGPLAVEPDANIARVLSEIRWRLSCNRSDGLGDILPRWWMSFGIDPDSCVYADYTCADFTNARKAAVAAATAASNYVAVTWNRIQTARASCANYVNPKKELKALERELAGMGGRGVLLADRIDDLRIVIATTRYLEKTVKPLPADQERARR